jgi:hypothetical protein
MASRLFGGRKLGDRKNVYDENAWDQVEWDETQLEMYCERATCPNTGSHQATSI